MAIRSRLSRWLAGALALGSVGLLAGGCGGGRSTTTTTTTTTAGGSSQYETAFAYARCMRQHGEPDFPDPRNPGGFPPQALAQLNTASPAFVSANDVCQRLLPNNGEPTPAELAQTLANGLKFAKCMRAHHVDLPDPGLSGGHLTINLANVNTSSPQFTTAGRTCAITPGG